jgi:cation diffusion facilitator family transporter
MKSRLFLFISLGVDTLIAGSKFVCAALTGSASMTAEAIHSVIDAVSQLLLIWGVKSSKRRADAGRPFGYGRELYYWSLIVSLVIFILGGCISFYEGLLRLQKPHFDGNPNWNYAVLGFAFFFNFISMLSALKAFNAQRGEIKFWRALNKTKDPSIIIVLLGDIGDLIGLVIAFLGIFLGRLWGNPALDAYASMLIGLLLIIISGFLIQESKSLLLGETISSKIKRHIINLAEADIAIVKIKKVSSIYRSPEDAMVMLNAKFSTDLTMKQLNEAIARVIQIIRKSYPQVTQVVIAPV